MPPVSAAALEPQSSRDWSSKAGAEALAAEIRRFWTAFGYDVQVWVEACRGGRNSVFTIKSSLRAGLPPPGSAVP